MLLSELEKLFNEPTSVQRLYWRILKQELTFDTNALWLIDAKLDISLPRRQWKDCEDEGEEEEKDARKEVKMKKDVDDENIADGGGGAKKVKKDARPLHEDEKDGVYAEGMWKGIMATKRSATVGELKRPRWMMMRM
jgi:hypothetical protein